MCIRDSARDPYNEMSNVLYANKSVGEGYRGDASTTSSDIKLEFLSNGFRPTTYYLEQDGGGDTLIYAAFAETPLNFANAR